MKMFLHYIILIITTLLSFGCSDIGFDNKPVENDVFSVVNLNKKEAMNSLEKVNILKSPDYKITEKNNKSILLYATDEFLDKLYNDSNDISIWIANKGKWKFGWEYIFIELEDKKTKIITRCFAESKNKKRMYYKLKEIDESLELFYSNLDEAFEKIENNNKTEDEKAKNL